MYKLLECWLVQNHMLLTLGYWFLYLLHYLQENTKSQAVEVHQNYSPDQRVYFTKNIQFPWIRWGQNGPQSKFKRWQAALCGTCCFPQPFVFPRNTLQRAQQAQNSMGRVFGGKAKWPHWALPFSFLNCFTGWYAYYIKGKLQQELRITLTFEFFF